MSQFNIEFIKNEIIFLFDHLKKNYYDRCDDKLNNDLENLKLKATKKIDYIIKEIEDGIELYDKEKKYRNLIKVAYKFNISLLILSALKEVEKEISQVESDAISYSTSPSIKAKYKLVIDEITEESDLVVEL